MASPKDHNRSHRVRTGSRKAVRNPLEVEENLELLFDREPCQFGPAQALRLENPVDEGFQNLIRHGGPSSTRSIGPASRVDRGSPRGGARLVSSLPGEAGSRVR